MGIVGFSFSKFNCERKSTKISKTLEIKHNIKVLSLEKVNLNIGPNKSDVLRIDFAFEVDYGKDLGMISIEGDVIYTDTKEIIEETHKQWESEKKLNITVSEIVFKFIYNKTAIKVLDLADSLNLPSPIPLPKINFSKKN